MGEDTLTTQLRDFRNHHVNQKFGHLLEDTSVSHAHFKRDAVWFQVSTRCETQLFKMDTSNPTRVESMCCEFEKRSLSHAFIMLVSQANLGSHL
jgi:hypothetical protein